MCEWFSGKMYCRCCGEAFYFNRENHRPSCPHIRQHDIKELKRRVEELERRADRHNLGAKENG